MPADVRYPNAEWIEPNGLGGFASGTVAGPRSRRYHGLLLHATDPPSGRVMLVNGVDVWIETQAGEIPLSSQHYAPDVVHPDGSSRIAGFRPDPWPTWVYQVGDLRVTCEVIVPHARSATLVRWRASTTDQRAILHVRPLLSGRDYHSLHKENPAFRFQSDRTGESILWRPYPGIPAIRAISNGDYEDRPDWYRNFLYAAEQKRGLDCIEDLASPGVFHFDLSRADAVLLLEAVSIHGQADCCHASAEANALREREASRRRNYENPWDKTADAYIVRRGSGKTIVAGYPWFTDWGRDTFIALRGLCLARGDVETARQILCEWSGAVSEGMLPNRFPDGGDAPEYNSVDASLWYIVAVHDLFIAARKHRARIPAFDQKRLKNACISIVSGYARGTRFGIRMDADGLLAAGTPGVQLTWMDAKVGDWVVTPRIGKPVEVEALWINALRIVSRWKPAWKSVARQAMQAFQTRFWNEEKDCLFDVMDVQHVAGERDGALRPNQILAVGGLPYPLLDGEKAKAVVDAVERELVTPLGLRSLAPKETGYRGQYRGGVWDRDSAYHQGTVWPWLMGPFVDAWLRVRGDSPSARMEAARRFLKPMSEYLRGSGLGHICEVADGDPPHNPGGCPFQAWSLGEFIRAQRMVECSELRSPAPAERMIKPKSARMLRKTG